MANSQSSRIALYFSLILFPQIAVSQIIFSAPPRENSEEARKLYEPLAKQLSRIIGKEVTYQQPKGWADYAKKMRKGVYDIVFDGPHFTAWRMKNLKHTPVASLPGTLDFYLVTHNKDKAPKNLKNLVGKSICAMPSPNLATDLVYDLFPNPVVQPIFYEVTGGMEKVFSEFQQGRCDAAIVRKNTYNNISKSEKSKLKILAKTRPLPNQTFTISNKLQSNHEAISKFLLSIAGAKTLDELLTRYSVGNKKLQPSQRTAFVGVEEILEGVVWGW